MKAGRVGAQAPWTRVALGLCSLALVGLPAAAFSSSPAWAAPRKAAAPRSLPALSVEKTCRQAEERQGPGLDTYAA